MNHKHFFFRTTKLEQWLLSSLTGRTDRTMNWQSQSQVGEPKQEVGWGRPPVFQVELDPPAPDLSS